MVIPAHNLCRSRGTWLLHGKSHTLSRTTATYLLDEDDDKNNMIDDGNSTTTESTTTVLDDSRLDGDATSNKRMEQNKRHSTKQKSCTTKIQGGNIAQQTKSVDGVPMPEQQDCNRREFVASPELQRAATYITNAVHKQQDQRRPLSSTCDSVRRWKPNFAFANRYADGNEYVGWHSDHITTLGPRPIIVGLTLGACRRFEFRQQPPPPPNNSRTHSSSSSILHVSIPLPHNSAIIMWDDSQESWQHAVPKCSSESIGRHPTVGLVRISLTFRMKRNDIPDLGLCYCGRPAGLKAKNGRYFLMCQPYGTPDKQMTCPYWKPCDWANAEATRLKCDEYPKHVP